MNLTFALSCVIAAMWLLCGKCDTTPDLASNRRLRNRPLFRGYTIEGLLAEDEDAMAPRKRQQQFDDYGHMRFGKREQFDDYGHMRFGRNHE